MVFHIIRLRIALHALRFAGGILSANEPAEQVEIYQDRCQANDRETAEHVILQVVQIVPRSFLRILSVQLASTIRQQRYPMEKLLLFGLSKITIKGTIS